MGVEQGLVLSWPTILDSIILVAHAHTTTHTPLHTHSGLGKTLQSITLAYMLLKTTITANNKPTIRRIIIVCPCSLVNFVSCCYCSRNDVHPSQRMTFFSFWHQEVLLQTHVNFWLGVFDGCDIVLGDLGSASCVFGSLLMKWV